MKKTIHRCGKKIGIFLESVPTAGGVYQYSLAVLKSLYALKEKGDIEEVVIICMNEEWEKYAVQFGFSHILVAPHDRYITWSIFKRLKRKPQWLYSLFIKGNDILYPLGRKLSKLKPDICIFTTWRLESILFSMRSVVPIHDLMHRYGREFPEFSSSYAGREELFSNLSKYATGILTDSEFGKKMVEEAYFSGSVQNKIYALPYIAPYYVFEKENELTDDEKARMEQLPHKFFFYPAQYWQHKNHISILKAMDVLKGKIPDIHVVFCGSSKNEYENLVKYISEKKLESNVTFLSYISNDLIKSIYRKSCALVMPTLAGPTNIPPLEAFALGCPVMTSGIYGIPEQLGDAALLFEPKNIDEIAMCMDRLWNEEELRRDLIEKGYKHTENWNQTQFAMRLGDILQDIRMRMEQD